MASHRFFVALLAACLAIPSGAWAFDPDEVDIDGLMTLIRYGPIVLVEEATETSPRMVTRIVTPLPAAVWSRHVSMNCGLTNDRATPRK